MMLKIKFFTNFVILLRVDIAITSTTDLANMQLNRIFSDNTQNYHSVTKVEGNLVNTKYSQTPSLWTATYSKIPPGVHTYFPSYLVIQGQDVSHHSFLSANHHYSNLESEEAPKIPPQFCNRCYEQVHTSQLFSNKSLSTRVCQLDLSPNKNESHAECAGGRDLLESSSEEYNKPQNFTSDFARSQAEENFSQTSLNSNFRQYLIVRRPINVLVTNCSVANRKQEQNNKLLDINFKMIGGDLDDVLSYPWCSREIVEGRRVMRVQRLQHESALKAYFLIVEFPMHLSKRTISGHHNFLEVSCIRFVSSDSVRTDYFITSVQVIEIIEFLIGNRAINSAVQWKERCRVRSNLASVWFKDWSLLGPIHLGFENQIQRYNSQNPHTKLKYVRLLRWSNLEYALQKALLFYCVFMPTEINPKPCAANF